MPRAKLRSTFFLSLGVSSPDSGVVSSKESEEQDAVKGKESEEQEVVKGKLVIRK